MTKIDTTTIRAAWDAAVAAYHAALAADAQGDGVDDDLDTALFTAVCAAYRKVIHTQSPDMAAHAFKLGLMVESHATDEGERYSLDFLKRTLAKDALDGGAALVRAWQDALRLAGIDHEVLTLG